MPSDNKNKKKAQGSKKPKKPKQEEPEQEIEKGSEMLQNANHEKFAQEFALRGRKGAAYMAAYEGVECIFVACSCACKLLKKAEIIERIDYLRKEVVEEYSMTREQKRDMLRRVMETPIDELDPESGSDNGDLIQSKTTTIRTDKHGNETVSVTVTGLSKLEAMKIDNVMAGHNEPEKHVVEHSGEIVTRPFKFTQEQARKELEEEGEM